ncbi:MAG TPA: hemin uptake protein HemP [Burkholderiaceae bacterium]|nr:hemin uptake protein HemP [Burkholderiaceae bacterium]
MSPHGKPPPPPASRPPPAPRPGQAPASPRLRWTSSTLLAGGREVEIEHEHVVYRLQLTALGKLILTK